MAENLDPAAVERVVRIIAAETAMWSAVVVAQRLAAAADLLVTPEHDAQVVATDNLIAEQVEAIVQAAYFQIAAEKCLTVACVAPGRAAVPSHWRAEAEERARPYLAALGIEVRDV